MDQDSERPRSDSALDNTTPTPTNSSLADSHRFAHEVLQLIDGQTEDTYEETLVAQAREVGVPYPADLDGDAASKPTSTLTASTSARRSTSVDSRASTGLTSNFSRGSKEQVPFGTISITRQDRRTSGNSLCIKDYDAILDNARRLSLNISPQISPAQSTFSLPASSSTESSPRRSIIRGLNKLRLRRPDSNGSSKE